MLVLHIHFLRVIKIKVLRRDKLLIHMIILIMLIGFSLAREDIFLKLGIDLNIILVKERGIIDSWKFGFLEQIFIKRYWWSLCLGALVIPFLYTFIQMVIVDLFLVIQTFLAALAVYFTRLEILHFDYIKFNYGIMNWI